MNETDVGDWSEWLTHVHKLNMFYVNEKYQIQLNINHHESMRTKFKLHWVSINYQHNAYDCFSVADWFAMRWKQWQEWKKENFCK